LSSSQDSSSAGFGLAFFGFVRGAGGSAFVARLGSALMLRALTGRGAADFGSDATIVAAPGTDTTSWHLGQRIFFPAAVPGTASFPWQAEHSTTIRSDMGGLGIEGDRKVRSRIQEYTNCHANSRPEAESQENSNAGTSDQVRRQKSFGRFV
jgi:hypothetical protein